MDYKMNKAAKLLCCYSKNNGFVVRFFRFSTNRVIECYNSRGWINKGGLFAGTSFSQKDFDKMNSDLTLVKQGKILNKNCKNCKYRFKCLTHVVYNINEI